MQLKVYETHGRVNRSTHSSVYKGEFKGDLVAVRRVKSGRLDVFEREIRQLSRLEHENLIHYIAVLRNRDGSLDVVMQLCELETLAAALVRYVHAPQWRFSIFGQLASGLRYLHENNIVHGELNPRNILFRDMLHCRPVIGNYSTSLRLNRPPKPRDDLVYKPPEKNITKQSDIFSLTVIGCSVLVHNYPRSPKAIKENILEAMRRREISNNTVLWNLIYRGVAKKAADRPPAALFEEGFGVEIAPSYGTRPAFRKSYGEDIFCLIVTMLTGFVLFLVFSDFTLLNYFYPRPNRTTEPSQIVVG